MTKIATVRNLGDAYPQIGYSPFIETQDQINQDPNVITVAVIRKDGSWNLTGFILNENLEDQWLNTMRESVTEITQKIWPGCQELWGLSATNTVSVGYGVLAYVGGLDNPADQKIKQFTAYSQYVYHHVITVAGEHNPKLREGNVYIFEKEEDDSIVLRAYRMEPDGLKETV